jgi:hypothetical protein
MPEAELDELVRAGLRSYARYWMEAFRLPSQSKQQFLDGFPLPAPGRARRPAIARAGARSWRCRTSATGTRPAAWVVAKGWPLVVVAERLKPERVYDRFRGLPGKAGMEVVPLTGGRRPPLDVLAEKVPGRGTPWRCSPTGTCRPRRRGEVLRRADPDAARTGALLALTTGAPPVLRRPVVFAPPPGRVRSWSASRCPGPARVRWTSGSAGPPSGSPTLRRRHRRAPAGLAHAAEALARPAGPGLRRPPCGSGSCRRTRSTSGRVQNHITTGRGADRAGPRGQRAGAADEDADLPPYVVPAGRPCRAVQRLGGPDRVRPVSTARVRRWLARGRFDVLHVHEPMTLSLSLLAVLSARGPVVATFHTAISRSRALSAAQGCCRWCRRRSPRGSRSASWPARPRSSTSAAAQWRSRTV